MRWWWSDLQCELPSPEDLIQRVRLTVPGWNEQTPTKDMRNWSDSEGDVLSLATSTEAIGLAEECDEMALRRACRALAQGRGAGMIESSVVRGGIGPSVKLIHKRLEGHSQVYTGMLITSVRVVSLIWTIVKAEQGMTGMREAAVFASLFSTGILTLDNFERHWAQDPYEPAYHGVERSCLRFMSDDESYDVKFPWHPLSKVRQFLTMLPNNVQLDSQEHGGCTH
jgi:hypothetical protein